MASRRNPSSSRRSSGGRSSSRSSRHSSSSNNQTPMILGGVGAVVLIIVLVVMNSTGDTTDDNSGNNTPSQASQPKAQPKPAPSRLAMSSSQAGKTPDRPAPELTAATLDKVNALLQEAKDLYNEGVKLRNAQKATEANAKQSTAAAKLTQLKNLIAAPLEWQEEADMDDWAQPGEYVTLAKLYGKVSSLENKVRKQGGKR